MKFEFTVEEANDIINALGAMPYGRVSALIHNIQEQAQPQLEAKEEKPASKKSK